VVGSGGAVRGRARGVGGGQHYASDDKLKTINQ
jgi:hypothetical protein